MRRFAEETTVSAEDSRRQIEKLLVRYGADGFYYGWNHGRAIIGFTAHQRQVRFELPMPDRKDPAITHTPETKVERSPAKAEAAYDQAVRRQWRVLLLGIQAKLETVASGLTTFEEEFLAHVVTPDGPTVGQWLAPQLEEAYASGRMPSFLPALPAGKAQ